MSSLGSGTVPYRSRDNPPPRTSRSTVVMNAPPAPRVTATVHAAPRSATHSRRSVDAVPAARHSPTTRSTS